MQNKFIQKETSQELRMLSLCPTLNSRVTMNDEIVVLNCQRCNRSLTCQKTLEFRVFSQCHCPHCLYSPHSSTKKSKKIKLFGHVMSPYHSDQMSQRSEVSRIAH